MKKEKATSLLNIFRHSFLKTFKSVVFFSLKWNSLLPQVKSLRITYSVESFT